MQQDPSAGPSAPPGSTLDAREVARFARDSDEWWDEKGKFRPLHEISPLRLAFLRDEMLRHFSRPAERRRPLEGLRVLDVGCGGGLICEPLARLGAHVSGLDPSPENIAAARDHAAGQRLNIDYRVGRVEELTSEGLSFDALVCLEVIEHVPDPAPFLKACATLMRPGALLLLSTINRTLKAYLLAIVAAEYLLRWLPVGTHRWDRFVTPRELTAQLAAAGLTIGALTGLVYNPLAGAWALAADTDVNYFATAAKPA
jgi:2-polyprenyl-6-hydroxyphenyl methylase / 3-demethylubiquinone-9 3-methyltransferase